MHVGEIIHLYTKLVDCEAGGSLAIHGELLTQNDYGVRIMQPARMSAAAQIFFIPWGSIDYITEEADEETNGPSI